MLKQTGITVIAWKKLSRRSELLAEALNAKMLFFKDNLPYARAAFKTLISTLRQKPRVLVLQLPQGPLLLEAYLIKKLVGCKIIADVHTGFLVNTNWKGLILNTPFVKLLSLADIIIAHNETQLELMPEKVKHKTIVVFDPWHLIVNQPKQNMQEDYFVFPASFASDEPLEEVIEAANSTDLDAKLYVTGNWKRKPSIKKYASNHIVFTGFLSAKKFNNLLTNASAIITGTKREYTALMSGWEAVAYNKTLAVTDTRTLRTLFGDYAVFYDWKNKASITQAIRKVLSLNPSIGEYQKLRACTITSLEMLKKEIEHLEKE